MKPDRNAAIAIIHAGEVSMRPGLFVFMTPNGFAWVEPGYLEPAPSREAFHRVAGALTASASGFSIKGEDGRVYMVGAIADLEPGIGADLRAACAWAAGEITAGGGTMDAERERLRQLLAADLA